MSQVYSTLSVILVFSVAALATAVEKEEKVPSSESGPATPELQVNVESGEEEYVHLVIGSERVLTKVAASFDDEQWQPVVELSGVEGSKFRTKHGRFPIPGRQVRVRAYDPELKKYVVATSALKVTGDSVGLQKVNVQYQDAAPSLAKADGLTDGSNLKTPDSYQGRFLRLLNRYRASRGLGPLSYSKELEGIAAINNQRGGYHRYTGGTPQVWAMGSATADGTLRQWQNSPGHNAILLGRGYSRVGIHFDGRGWTANLR